MNDVDFRNHACGVLRGAEAMNRFTVSCLLLLAGCASQPHSINSAPVPQHAQADCPFRPENYPDCGQKHFDAGAHVVCNICGWGSTL